MKQEDLPLLQGKQLERIRVPTRTTHIYPPRTLYTTKMDYLKREERPEKICTI